MNNPTTTKKNKKFFQKTIDKHTNPCYNNYRKLRKEVNIMKCKDCADKEDCCFYNKEEENFTCWLEACRKWYEAHQDNESQKES